MPKYLGNTALSYLRTNYYYTSLNEENDDCQDEAFYNAAKKKLENYQWLQDISKQILKGLCYVYRKRLKRNFESDICKFLYFWLGNILLEKMSHNIVFFDVISNLFDILKHDNFGKICKLPHYYMDVNHFKNIKLFFDYSEDYYSYKHQLTGLNHSCNEEYKTYLDKYVKSYNEVKVECADNQNLNSYCKEFNDYFNDKDNYHLSNWKCVLDKHGHEEEELEEDSVAQGPILSPGLGNGVHTGTIQNEVSSEIGQKVNRPGSSVYHRHEGISDLSNISNLPEDSSPSTIKKSITSAASAAGLLVPPFLIYNYTPAGTWISKLLGRNKGPTRNPYANPELMENFSMPGDFDSERNRYNIMYRPE
ncbi:PIR protein [Plasmodium vivax]|nr:PIR protein [Plasmodium vivax]